MSLLERATLVFSTVLFKEAPLREQYVTQRNVPHPEGHSSYLRRWVVGVRVPVLSGGNLFEVGLWFQILDCDSFVSILLGVCRVRSF